MARTNDEPAPVNAQPAEPGWADLFPADPDLMTSAEGDAKGLAELKQRARERIARRAAR